MTSIMGLHYTGFLPLISLALFITALASSIARKGRVAARAALAASVTLIAGWLVYEIPFITLDFSLHEVYWNTSPGLPLWMRIASAWAGGGGSLFLFTVIGAIGYVLSSRKASSLRLLATYSTLEIGVLLSAFLNDAFTALETPPPSGAGLNPLLKSPWLYPHPLTTFGGYALLAVGSLVTLFSNTRETEKKGAIVYGAGWASLTVGIMLGGLWSYETFGWGGYWAWDPVETSELMVWLLATAFFHLAVVSPSSRKAFLSLTASSILLAMYVTRTGLSPLHSFAAPSIGALILLGGGIAGLAFFLYHIGLKAAAIGGELRRSLVRTLYSFGLTLAAIALTASAFIVYATLLVPSILVALGENISVPQMSSGIAYFHPALYPLALVFLAAIPASFLSDRYGWKGYLALTASTALVSAIAGLAALQGGLKLAPLSPPLTNAEMVVGLIWSFLALSTLLGYLASLLARAKTALRNRFTGISILHIGMVLTLIGVFMSGTFAYNQYYFHDITLRPNSPIELPGGYSLQLDSYSYHISESKVDIYTRYVGRSETYFMAWLGLNTLASDIADMVSALTSFKEKLHASPELEFALKLASSKDYNLTRVVLPLAELVQRDLSSNTTLKLPPATINKTRRIILENTTWWINTRPFTSKEGTLRATEIQLVVQAGQVIIENTIGAASEKTIEIPSFHIIYEASLGNTTIKLSGNLTLEATNITILPAAIVESAKSGRVLANSTTIVLEKAYALVTGRLVDPKTKTSIEVPTLVDRGLVVYLYYKTSNDPYLKAVVNSTLASILSDPHNIIFLTHSEQCLAAGGCQGYVAAPKLVPETAWLDLEFTITTPGGSNAKEKVTIRFEAYGEIQGIHGLVPRVVRILDGLNEIYIVVHVPVVGGENIGIQPSASYHELLVYYLHEATRNMTLSEKLALTALMASGYNIDSLRRLLQEAPSTATYMLEKSIIDLYLLAENYNPQHSVIAEKGILVQVKVIPGAPLVFIGPLVMALGEALSLLVASMKPRREN